MTLPVARTTLRVRRHRAARQLVRVEVEVPTAEDARTIRHFAAERRAGSPAAVASLMPDDTALGEYPRRAIRLFAAAVAKAANPEAIARALRVAANFSDAVDYQARMRDGDPAQ
jgi:hypothetical protein